ncbi:MAG: DUF1905 domain-containing protein [Candidatus Limimorpha sp.]
MRSFEFDAKIIENKDNGGAYIVFPWDIREEFGAGRVKCSVLFDGIPYRGSIVNMGVKGKNGDICYIIGVLKSIREQLNKSDGDIVRVKVEV